MSQIILSENLLERGTLSATDTATGYDVANVTDPNGATAWAPASAGWKYIRTTLGSYERERADSLGIAYHELAGHVVMLRRYDGTAYLDVPDDGHYLNKAYRVPDNGPVFVVSEALADNLAPYSRTFASWTRTAGVSVASSNVAAGYDGAGAADHLDINTASGDQSTETQLLDRHTPIGQPITLSVYVSRLAGVGVDYPFRFYIWTGTTLYESDEYTSVAGQWTRYEYTFTADMADTRSYLTVGLRFRQSDYNGAYSLLFDAFAISRGSEAARFVATGASAHIGGDQVVDAAIYPPSNLWPNSEDLSAGTWSITGATVTTNAAEAPDGTYTADRLVEQAATSAHYVSVPAATYQKLTGVPCTLSFYARAQQCALLYVRLPAMHGTTEASAVFNLAAGTCVIGGGGLTAYFGKCAMEPVLGPSGHLWYRCSLSAVADATDYIQPRIYMLNDSGSNNYGGTAGRSVLLWGLQFEHAPAPTKYVPTTTAGITGTVGRIGYLALGESDRFHGAAVGATPAGLSPHYKVLNAESDGGRLVGRSVIQTSRSQSIALRFLTSAWARSRWPGFKQELSARPFFYAWHEASYPAECALCWSDGDLDEISYKDDPLMGVDIKARVLR